jgi:signal transduction histidine kinase
MNSLLGRIIALAAVIALVSTAICAFAVSIDPSHTATEAAVLRSKEIVFITGLITAVVAVLIGTWLGWSWLKPIIVLADWCRRRAHDPSAALPNVGNLSEARDLAHGLSELLQAQRGSEEALAAALDRETTVNAVHQRFLTQLGQEFGQPIRRLINTIDRLHLQSGRMEPEDVEASRQAALQLEERFQEVLGLAQDDSAEPSPLSQRHVDDYLSGVVELMRPVAARRGLTLQYQAPHQLLPIDARLLTPILVNLISNAFKAMGSVSVEVRIDRGDSVWHIADTGPGLPGDLADRVGAACVRGEVLPGEPGMGLGLALSLANARALGGQLRLINQAKGATFELRVPAQSVSTTRRRRA